MNPKILEIQEPAMKDCFRDFLLEGPEHVGALEQETLKHLRGESCDALKIFRAVHTLKGIFGFLGFEELGKLAHELEEHLEPHKRSNGVRLPEVAARSLAEFSDLVEQQLQYIQADLEGGQIRKIELTWLKERHQGLSRDLPGETQVAQDSHLKIAVAKLDSLLEALGEVATLQAQLDSGLHQGKDRAWLESQSARLRGLCHQAHELTLRLRMLPIEPIFQRCERQALELAKRLKKSLRVVWEGGQTEIDKSVAEALQEPLLHLLRNALDHGLEEAGERESAGKTAQGLLQIHASHQGGDFVLHVEDDGKGLDLARLRQKAESLGYLAREESIEDEALMDLIFEPGFSTADAVSEISGRGVGLDSVRGSLRKLNGSVKVTSEAGRGCRFVMRLPLTLAQVDALEVLSGSGRYLLPANQVRRIFSLKGLAQHEYGAGQRWVEHEGQSLSLVAFGNERTDAPLAVHVDTGAYEAAILVDAVLGKQQSVVKSVGPLVSGRGPYTGAAVLDDGGIGFILDLEALLHPAKRPVLGASL